MDQIIEVLKTIRPEFDYVGVDDFFSRGMLDSFDLTQLISSLEERFGISVDGEDIVPENFQNAEAIASLLKKYGVTI